MKKVFIIIASILLGLVLITSPVYAGPGCCASKSAVKCTTLEKSDQTVKSADATIIKKCEYKGRCADVTLVIEGMEDADSETTVEEVLSDEDGVIVVASVSYKEGRAAICFDPDKTEPDKLVTAIADLGFEAEVVAESEEKVIGCDFSSEKCKIKCSGEKRSHKL